MDSSKSVDLSAMVGASDGVQDLYPTEKNALKTIAAAMMRRHAFKGVLLPDQETAIMRTFETEMRNRAAEIGLVVDVLWEWESDEKITEDGVEYPARQSPSVSHDPDDQNLYWIPNVVVTDRVSRESETDHDRMKHEIRAGLDGGRPGVIDPNTGEHKDQASRIHIY